MRQRVGQGGGHVVDLLLLVVVMVVVMVLLDVMRGRRRGRVQQGGRVARRRRGRRHGNIGTVSVQRLGAGFVQGRGVVGAVSAVLGRTSSRHSVGNKLIRFIIISHFKLNYILRLLLSLKQNRNNTHRREKKEGGNGRIKFPTLSTAQAGNWLSLETFSRVLGGEGGYRGAVCLTDILSLFFKKKRASASPEFR